MKKVDVESVLVAMYEGKLPEVRLNSDGAELCDPMPMAPPVGYRKQPSMVEIVRDMVRSERMAAIAMEGGLETFEEADDFDVGDDFDPASPYENDFEPTVADLRQRRFEAEQLSKGDHEDVITEPKKVVASSTKAAKVKKSDKPTKEKDDGDDEDRS